MSGFEESDYLWGIGCSKKLMLGDVIEIPSSTIHDVNFIDSIYSTKENEVIESTNWDEFLTYGYCHKKPKSVITTAIAGYIKIKELKRKRLYMKLKRICRKHPRFYNKQIVTGLITIRSSYPTCTQTETFADKQTARTYKLNNIIVGIRVLTVVPVFHPFLARVLTNQSFFRSRKEEEEEKIPLLSSFDDDDDDY